MTVAEFKSMALSFDGVEEHPHFDRMAFKVTGKRIFTTVHEQQETANVLLSPAGQSVFCQYDKNAVYPVPNKWGQQGWTTFVLKNIPRELMLDALDAAYQTVVKGKTKKK